MTRVGRPVTFGLPAGGQPLETLVLGSPLGGSALDRRDGGPLDRATTASIAASSNAPARSVTGSLPVQSWIVEAGPPVDGPPSR